MSHIKTGLRWAISASLFALTASAGKCGRGVLRAGVSAGRFTALREGIVHDYDFRNVLHQRVSPHGSFKTTGAEAVCKGSAPSHPACVY